MKAPGCHPDLRTYLIMMAVIATHLPLAQIGHKSKQMSDKY
jgi:hypothetical protein